MPVKIRLTRVGKKKQPAYRVVVMDSRKPRDGAYLEQIGFYDPRQEPSKIEIDNDAALKWLQNGAQPTDRARKLLEISGAWTQFKVSRGEIHVATPTAAPAPVVHVVEHTDEGEVEIVPHEPEAAVEDVSTVEPVVDTSGDMPEASEETTETGEDVAAVEPVVDTSGDAAEASKETTETGEDV